MEKKVRQRLPGERVFVVALVGFSLFMLWSSYGISGFKSLTSAGMFPMLASAVMVGCMLVVVVQTLRSEAEPHAEGEGAVGHFFRRVAPPVVLVSSLVIAAYMFALEWLGFLVGSYLFLVVAMWVLGSRRLMANLVVSAVVLAAIYAIFQTAFSVILPEGTVWQGLFNRSGG